MILPISARNVQKKETSDDDDDNDEEEDEEEEKEEDSEQAVCLLPQKADDKIKSWVRNLGPPFRKRSGGARLDSPS